MSQLTIILNLDQINYSLLEINQYYDRNNKIGRLKPLRKIIWPVQIQTETDRNNKSRSFIPDEIDENFKSASISAFVRKQIIAQL